MKTVIRTGMSGRRSERVAVFSDTSDDPYDPVCYYIAIIHDQQWDELITRLTAIENKLDDLAGKVAKRG